MKKLFNPSRWVAAVLASTVFGAQAHTGLGTHGLLEGLAHPLGADHLLAMLAVGVWSVSSLPERRVWQGPAVFMLTLVCSAVAGAMGAVVPYLEHAIALSVVFFGAMLVLSVRSTPFRPTAGLFCVALASALHGLAHGAETPGTGFLAYALGFLLSTAGLHLGGLGVGVAIKRGLMAHRRPVLRGLGMALGLSGLYLFAQL